ncbi:RHS repeat-associated core domain-containing protein [Candidatus Neomarinimicrobiota bacterium]
MRTLAIISDYRLLTSFKYNAAGERVEKTANTGMVDKYIMGRGKMMSAYTSDGKRRNYIYDGAGRRVALSFHVGSWSGNYFFYNDMLGSVREFARADQSFVYKRNYYPFGQDRGATGGLGNPEHFRFTGKAEDAETGLYYFGARYYDAELGRWTQPDPLWAKYPGWSPYNYALNNPLKYVDPDGRIPLPLIGAAAGAVFGAGKEYYNQVQTNYSNGLSGSDALTSNISRGKIAGAGATYALVGAGGGEAAVIANMVERGLAMLLFGALGSATDQAHVQGGEISGAKVAVDAGLTLAGAAVGSKVVSSVANGALSPATTQATGTVLGVGITTVATPANNANSEASRVYDSYYGPGGAFYDAENE